MTGLNTPFVCGEGEGGGRRALNQSTIKTLNVFKWETTKHDVLISIDTDGPITGDWGGGGGEKFLFTNRWAFNLGALQPGFNHVRGITGRSNLLIRFLQAG